MIELIWPVDFGNHIIYFKVESLYQNNFTSFLVPKILKSTDQLSSTIWFLLNRMWDRFEITTAQ